MSTQLNLYPPTLPPGYCFTTWQQLLNDFFNGGFALFPNDLTTWNYGSSIPAADKRDRPWYRTNVDGSPDRIYGWHATYAKWVSPNPIPPTSLMYWIWDTDLTTLKTYDGGADEPVVNAEVDGPMWEEATNMRGRLPLGPGTLNGSSTSVSQGATNGADQTTLTAAQGAIQDHQHIFGQRINQPNDDARFLYSSTVTIPATSSMAVHGDSGDPQNSSISTGDLITSSPVVGGTIYAGTNSPVNLMNPYRGVYFIKRTARKYYVAV